MILFIISDAAYDFNSLQYSFFYYWISLFTLMERKIAFMRVGIASLDMPYYARSAGNRAGERSRRAGYR